MNNESAARQRHQPRSKLLLAATAIIAIIAALLYLECSSGLTAGKLERMMQAEIPPRATRAEVEAWFDKHGFSHAYHEDRIDIEINANRAGLSDRLPEFVGQVGGEIASPQGNPGCGRFFRGRVRLVFFFDREGRVAGHLVGGEIPML